MLSLLCRNPHGSQQPPVESRRSHFCCPVFWCRPGKPHQRTKSAGTIVMRTLSWRRKTRRVQIGTTKLLLRQQVAREKRWTCPLFQRASVRTYMLIIQKMQWGSSLSGTLEKKLSERISITSWNRKNLVFEQSFMTCAYLEQWQCCDSEKEAEISAAHCFLPAPQVVFDNFVSA